jgi:type II secretory pathway pseudopilin PulG
MTSLCPNRCYARPAATRDSEEGYVLLTAIFFLALLILSLSVAAPQVAKSIQRDRDLETYHRGLQYRRAVQLYYRKMHAYPPNVDALVNTNNIRFLRKKYIDPITGQSDWKPVLYGQNKVPTAMGFFGQPLAGNASSLVGVGPSGGNGPLGSMNPGGTGSAFGSGGSLGGGGTFGGGSIGGGSTPGSFGGDQSTGAGTSSGTPGSTTPGSTSGTTSGTSGTSSDTSGQTFGGAGIIGFSPASSKQSILVYKKKDHYNEWEFTYDPLSDMKTMGGGNMGTIGQPIGGAPTPGGTSSPSPFGSSPGTTPNPAPTTPTTPTTPQ